MPVKDCGFGRPGTHDTQPGEVGIYKPLGAFLDGKLSYLQPRQGMVADCYLIASMISLAWAAPVQWRQRLDEACPRTAASDSYGFRFIAEDGGSVDAIDLQPWVPVDPLNRPYFAGPSTEPVTPGVPGGPVAPAWPALVEKAFVMHRQLVRDDPAPFDYQLIGDDHWFPKRACHALIGGTPYHRWKPSTPVLAPEIKCDEHDVTLHPTMASTQNDTTDTMKAKGLTWESTGLHSGHVYAVLGCMTQGDVDYVVLRNPWDNAIKEFSGYAKEAWQPGLGKDPVILNQHGVFAISFDWFERCFYRVDWVEL